MKTLIPNKDLQIIKNFQWKYGIHIIWVIPTPDLASIVKFIVPFKKGWGFNYNNFLYKSADHKIFPKHFSLIILKAKILVQNTGHIDLWLNLNISLGINISVGELIGFNGIRVQQRKGLLRIIFGPLAAVCGFTIWISHSITTYAVHVNKACSHHTSRKLHNNCHVIVLASFFDEFSLFVTK